jgi:hypothetical protein
MGSRKDRAAKAARRAAHAARQDHRGQEPRPSEQRAARKAPQGRAKRIALHTERGWPHPDIVYREIGRDLGVVRAAVAAHRTGSVARAA